MEVEEAIMQRRSVRSYRTDKTVPFELISRVLDAARFAPSSGNLQNWKVVLVSEQNKKVELAAAALRQKWIVSAPVLIVVCNQSADVKRLYQDRGEFLYSVQNVANFVQNILLTAHSLGLATCWVGAFDPEAVRRVLRIPDEVEPEAIISLGYAAEKVHAPSKKPIDQFTFFETWGVWEKGFGAFPLEKHKGSVENAGKRSKSILGRLFS